MKFTWQSTYSLHGTFLAPGRDAENYIRQMPCGGTIRATTLAEAQEKLREQRAATPERLRWHEVNPTLHTGNND